MSKIGKQTIQIPAGVTVTLEDERIVFRGPKGEIIVPMLSLVSAKLEDGTLSFLPREESKQASSNWGTIRALSQNALTGVTVGYNKELEIEGVGFRAVMEGKDLVIHIGYSHPVKVPAPEGITFNVEKNTMVISGIDKHLVGQTAADIRKLKKPEPYKGKGIRYKGEIIKRKSGKKVAGAAA